MENLKLEHIRPCDGGYGYKVYEDCEKQQFEIYWFDETDEIFITSYCYAKADRPVTREMILHRIYGFIDGLEYGDG